MTRRRSPLPQILLSRSYLCPISVSAFLCFCLFSVSVLFLFLSYRYLISISYVLSCDTSVTALEIIVQAVCKDSCPEGSPITRSASAYCRIVRHYKFNTFHLYISACGIVMGRNCNGLDTAGMLFSHTVHFRQDHCHCRAAVGTDILQG